MKLKIKATYIILILIFLPLLSFGQVVFEQGYFIANDGTKTNCLIKNYEWKRSPDKIDYRMNVNSVVEEVGISNLREFQVANYKFIKAVVDIDQSSRAINNLSTSRLPIFKKDTVFLRVLVEGHASLYLYGNRDLYFFNVDTSAIKQLIHKEYISEKKVLKNETYKTQLLSTLKCEDITLPALKRTNYNARELKNIFEKYNSCTGADYSTYELHIKRDAFNLYINAGIRQSSFTVSHPTVKSQNFDFGTALSLAFGLDAEFIVPFNRNKWAFIIRPVYQSFNAAEPRQNYNITTDYQSVEISLGVKHYMFLRGKSSIFLTGSFVLIDLPINSSIGSFEVKTTNNLIFGVGYKYNNRYSAEFYYSTSRTLMRNYAYYSSNYQSLTFLIGINVY